MRKSHFHVEHEEGGSVSDALAAEWRAATTEMQRVRAMRRKRTDTESESLMWLGMIAGERLAVVERLMSAAGMQTPTSA